MTWKASTTPAKRPLLRLVPSTRPIDVTDSGSLPPPPPGAVGYSQRARLEGLTGHEHETTGWTGQDRPVAEAGGSGDVANGHHERSHRRSSCPEQAGRRIAADSGGGLVADSNRLSGQVNANPRGSTEGDCAGELAGHLRSGDGAVDNDNGHGRESRSAAATPPRHGRAADPADWSNAEWLVCHDGKARRIPDAESGIRLLVDGLPERLDGTRANRTEAIKGFGNAIVPKLAAEVMLAYLDTLNTTRRAAA